MLTTETKRHIDAARQVLVGVVPNPTSQIDQITNALIYKFMDDMDQSAIKAGGNPSFFIGDLEKYAWTRLMDSRMGNQERMNLYSEALVKFSEAKQLPELFRGIFKSAFLPYRSPEVLGLFLKEISHFDYSHSEELGNAYEYLLSIMSSQGDAGQFRTPRHIIDFMVKVINPTKDDKVLDPACGTGGFLVSSYKHILSQHDGKDESGNPNDEKSLTPDDRKKLIQNFEGYDIDPGMVRISQVNMYLHQFKNPKIYQYDSLSMDERWNDKFDVILANPPFMSPKGGIKPHSKFSIQSSRSEVLFVDYIMNHLRPKGRAGVIVPEGIIFQSGSAYKQLRKNLVEDGLYAVVSLPSGVFQPYSGVKTSILFFDNELAKQSEDILFIRVLNDGYSLGAQRRPVDRDDLPYALKVLQAQSIAIQTGNENTLLQEGSMFAWSVTKKNILGAESISLSGDHYRGSVDHSDAKWPMVELGDLFGMTNGRAFKKTEWGTQGLPIIRIQNLNDALAEFNYYSGEYNNEILVKAGDLLFSWSGTRGTSFGPHIWTRLDGLLNQHIYKFNPIDRRIDLRYAYYVLNSSIEAIEKQAHGAGGLVHITKTKLKAFKIPLPPIEIQKQIVDELDGYKKIIDGARQIVDNWKPQFEIDPEWEKVKLGEVCDVRDGTHDSPIYVESGIPLITSKNLKHRKIDFDNVNYVSQEDHRKISKRSGVDDGDVLFAMIGTIGNPVVVKKDREFSIKNVALFKFRGNKKLKNVFLAVLLDSRYAMDNLLIKSRGGTQKFVSLKDLRDFSIPLPSLDIQKQIIEKIEAEKKMVESAKGLIDIYEEKVKERIERVWGK